MNQQTIAGIVGCGLVGGRVAEQLSQRGVRVALYDTVTDAARAVAQRCQGDTAVVERVSDLHVADVMVLCQPHPHSTVAAAALAAGVSVVSVADDVDDVRQLCDFAAVAEATRCSLIVGAAMAPGLSTLLARYLAAQLPQIDEIHVAIHGTAGPACARQHHAALGDTAIGWHDGAWINRPGGSGRELCWFPDPIGPHDCYRGGLADPLVLQRCFPDVRRISARVSGTRRDRLTARLPMLTPPHRKGNNGAVRVEVRGADDNGARVTLISGCAGETADLSAAVCASVALSSLDGAFPAGVQVVGQDPAIAARLLPMAIEFGVCLQEFTGVARASSW